MNDAGEFVRDEDDEVNYEVDTRGDLIIDGVVLEVRLYKYIEYDPRLISASERLREAN